MEEETGGGRGHHHEEHDADQRQVGIAVQRHRDRAMAGRGSAVESSDVVQHVGDAAAEGRDGVDRRGQDAVWPPPTMLATHCARGSRSGLLHHAVFALQTAPVLELVLTAEVCDGKPVQRSERAETHGRDRSFRATVAVVFDDTSDTVAASANVVIVCLDTCG